MAHLQQAEAAVLPAREEGAHIAGRGVLPASPDPGQRPAGERQGQHVEQVQGELAHLRRQVVEAVVEALEGPGQRLGQPLRRYRAFQQHRNQGLEHGQVAGAEHREAGPGPARRAATEAGGQARGGERGRAEQADPEQRRAGSAGWVGVSSILLIASRGRDQRTNSW
ncbi:hypothetical protein I0E98_15265 [Pseudomonas lalucatii]|nr:hypothetical protein [Pseudomonas lalucatii]